jgi:hypothetical protein
MAINARPGDLFLFTRARKLNLLITAYSRTPYYHVAFYAGGPFVVEARPRGVVRRDLRGPDGDKDFVVIPAPCDRETAVRALRWAEDRIGLGYDPLNTMAMVIDRSIPFVNIPPLPNHRFSCGELVTKALREAGFDPLPGMEAEDVLPSDYMRFLPADPAVCHGAPRGGSASAAFCEPFEVCEPERSPDGHTASTCTSA